MGRYLAVIQDSFREALASRVLWILLALITLLLLALAPLGYREELTWRLREDDVRDWPKLMVQFRESAKNSQPSPTRHIFSLLDKKLQDDLRDVKIPNIDSDAQNPFSFVRVMGRLGREMNKVLERRDFYNAEAFRGVPLEGLELRQLRDDGIDKLADRELFRFNRLVFEAAFPDLVRASMPTSVQLIYGWTDFGDPIPLRGESLRDGLQANAAGVLKYLIGALGVFIAILVTAPIIPQMFDPGALHLLLSKPVSRWMLFLAKFFGGCAFIFIGAAYLIAGLWLILGVRFGVWDAKILLSIPLYLFVFAIYYAVSALAGVLYRSPVVSIALTILFWGACWLIGTSKIAFESAIWNKSRLIQVFAAGDSWMAVNEMGMTHEWDEAKHEWREVFVSPEQRQIRGMLLVMPAIPREFRAVGPVYDERHDRLVSAQPAFPPTKLALNVGQRGEQWEPRSKQAAPAGTFAMFREPSGSVLVVSSLGLFRLTGDPLKKQEPMTLPFLDWKIPLPDAGPFEAVGPAEPVLVTQPASAAMHPSSGSVVVYTRGRLTVLRPDEGGRFERVVEHEFPTDDRPAGVLGFGGETILLAQADGKLRVFDAHTLAQRAEFQPEGKNQPRFVAASPDGRWLAVTFHNGRLWLYDAKSNTITAPRVSGQSDIASATFTKDGQLVAVDQTVRVTLYEADSWKVAKRYSPKLGWLASGYKYGLVPAYTLFPKPGELGTTFDYFLSGKETRGTDTEDLTSAQRDVHPWTPLWSSALFMVVILAAACIYIEWQEV